MNNFNVFNTEHNPVYMQQNNVFTSPGINGIPELDAAKSGALFLLSTGSVAVGGGTSLLLQAANPSGSAKKLYLSRISGGASAAAALTVFSGGTITGGTTPAPVNALLGSATATVATTRQNAGTLGGTPTTVMAMQITAGMYVVDFGGGLIVQANQTLSVALGTGALTGSINLTWWEA
ncbi:hypothetical protein [Paenibacillus sacheonensis]|uniref:Uncharacterized protein n=1 Tax=Paenibacillus sacheonensis TaxID=742054 RepID=A0A7X5C264_9BACL|nr:hypothetical protein [Paenibacillus sacheonensis]MBM7566614.1 hypothetical protein [Paenibacillus sacheonensis]NBC73532.1 hypothetical protein [Paenibacillus sacheonensis]